MTRKQRTDPIVLFCCENTDGFHGDILYHLRWVVVDGVIIIATGEDDFRYILEEHPFSEIVLITSPCPDCMKKGVHDEVGLGMIDRAT